MPWCKRSLFALLVCWPTLLLAGTSNSLMDVSPNGRMSIVANTDNGSVTVIDLAESKVLREIPVGKKPEGLAWIGDGPLAAVTLYHEGQIILVNAMSGTIERK